LRPGVKTLKAKKAPAKKPAARKVAKKAAAKKKSPSESKPKLKSKPKAAVKSPVKTKTPVKANTKSAAKPAVKAAIKAKAKAKSKPRTKPKKAPVQKKFVAPAQPAPLTDLLKRVITSLEDDKAENIVTIDLEGRSALCDAAVIASGRSSRHVAAIADHLARRLKEGGYGTRPVSGAATGDWVLVDAGDIIVHVFRPEVRDYYDLEGMWNVGTPGKV
jgi:ribosome-associated protein